MLSGSSINMNSNSSSSSSSSISSGINNDENKNNNNNSKSLSNMNKFDIANNNGDQIQLKKCGFNSTNANIITNNNTNSSQSDLINILFLFGLYLLQGIPLGLTASLPLILSSRNVSYSDQAWFSLASWPFSMKLLWAPLVDSVYIKRIGRRKSWLVPIQVRLMRLID